MKHDGIIFDIDGTLWDATPAVTESWNRALEKLGIEKRVTLDGIKSVMGHPLEECVEILLPDVKILHDRVMAVILEDDFDSLAHKKAIIYPGVKQGTEELAQSHKLFLVSNCGDRYLNIFLDCAGIRPFFTAYDCFGNSHAKKFQMIKGLVKKYSLKKPVYVGDTPTDFEGAKGAGVDFIHAAYGFGKISEEVTSFDNFPDVVRYLNS